MGFDIRYAQRNLQQRLVIEGPRPAALGRVTIGDYEEDFYSPIDAWTCKDYEEQWREAFLRLQAGLDSCFVVAVHPPAIAAFIECWFFWRIPVEYRIQNQFFFPHRSGDVDPKNPYDAIWPYQNYTEDGDRIYDWSLPLTTFLENSD